MYVESIPNRNSNPAVLIRQSYKKKNGAYARRTIANISKLPKHVQDGIQTLLKGGVAIHNSSDLHNIFSIVRSYPHGHVAAALGMIRTLGLHTLISRKSPRKQALVCALIAARILHPGSKLATARAIQEQSAHHSMARELGLEQIDEDDLYEAMDYLLEQQPAIERTLARRHLQNGTIVLCDVTSTYMEGQCLPIAQYGYSRDKKKGKKHIIFGLLCTEKGCPVAVEVFPGNIADPTTVASHVNTLKHRFGLSHFVIVGDRGLLTKARIDQDIRPSGLDWITGLRKNSLRIIMQQPSDHPPQTLSDAHNIAEITHPDYPGERLIVCRNPLYKEQQTRKRQQRIARMDQKLDHLVRAVTRTRRPLRGRDHIQYKLGTLLGTHTLKKFYTCTVTDTSLVWQHNTAAIAEAEALDGLYILRTSVSSERMEAPRVVRSYKQLSTVEQAFRSFKSIDLKVRPVFHYREDRVRCHIFLCMLAYYVEWHMRQRLAPLLFDEEDPAAAVAARTDIVAPAQVSPATQQKTRTGRTAEGLPVQSFRSLLDHLATLTKNIVRPKVPNATEMVSMLAEPTPLQAKAFSLLGIRLK